MKYYHNIETRKFPGHAHYIGYGAGKVWRVSKIGKQAWKAVTVDYTSAIYEKTLSEISTHLEALK